MKMQWCTKKNQSCSGMLKYKQITKKDKCSVERDSAGLEAVNLDLAHSPASNPPPPSPSPAIRQELHFREPVLCTIERNLCSFWAHIVTCLSCSLFFFSFTELKGGRKRRPSENTRNVFCCLLQPWWLKGFLSVCSNKYLFLLVFGTALLCRSSNGWLLVFHSGIRKWQYITSS